MSVGWSPSWRDDLACWIANFALDHIATPRYRALVGGSVKLGIMTALARNDDEVASIAADAAAALQHAKRNED